MNRIYNFSGFLNHLNEIRFSDHWIGRTTSSGSSEDKKESRIIPYDKNSTDSGYVIEGLLTKNGEYIYMMDFLKRYNLTEVNTYNLVTYALKAITRSRTIADWMSDSGKDYVMLYLGRIFFYMENGEKYYVILKSGVSEKAKNKILRSGREPFDFYNSGDVIYGYVREKDKGMTIKYYPSTPQGEKSSYHDFKNDTKLTDADFFSNYALEFPYGKGFEILIDTTDTRNTSDGPVLNIPRIQSKIDHQIQNGKEIQLGPKPEEPTKPAKDFLSPEWKRFLLTKGIVISLQKQGESNGKIYEIIEDPINIKEIKSAYESGNLKDMSIQIKAMEKYRNPYGILANLKSLVITITPGDNINIIRTLKAQKGGKGIDPATKYIFKFITSEPKIIENGQVQIALDIIQ